MVFFVLATLLSWCIDLGTLRFQSDRNKELEILLLRRQLAILQRTQQRPPRLSRWEKVGLAVLKSKLRSLPTESRSHVQESICIFTPATVLRWHREGMSDMANVEWRDYELLTQTILREAHLDQGVESLTVEHDVTLQGKVLTHQIDVLIRFEKGGVRRLVIVQCKDWNSTVEQVHLLAFASVLEDLPEQPRGIFLLPTSTAGRKTRRIQRDRGEAEVLHGSPADRIAV